MKKIHPKRKTVRLSNDIYNGDTIAAIAVASHECGHAIQHATGYLPIKIRSAIVPITNIGSRIAMPLIMLGIVLSYTSEYIGVFSSINCIWMKVKSLQQQYYVT